MLGSHGYLFHPCMQLYEVKPLSNADVHFTTYFTSKFTLGSRHYSFVNNNYCMGFKHEQLHSEIIP